MPIFIAMKYVLVVLGSFSLALAILGIFVPLLPTTPFLLLSAALYFRSSPRLYEWLLAHRCLGVYIRNFREYKAIPLRAKIVSLVLLWGTILYGMFRATDRLWLRILLACIAVGVSLHILSFRTLGRDETFVPGKDASSNSRQRRTNCDPDTTSP